MTYCFALVEREFVIIFEPIEKHHAFNVLESFRKNVEKTDFPMVRKYFNQWRIRLC